MIWNSIGNLFYQGCLWLITIIVVVISGYEDAGILAYATSIGNMYFALAVYNMRVYQISDVTDENTQGNYVAMRIITACGAMLIMTTYLFLTTSSLPLLLATLCMFLFKADESMSGVYYGVEQRAGRMDYIGKSQIARGLVILVLFSSALYITQCLDLSILAMSVACIFITIYYDRTNASRFFSVAPCITIKKGVYLLKRCFPAALTLLIMGSVIPVSRQIFEHTFGSELLGVYAAIATPTVLVQVLASYLYSPLLGPIAEAWNGGKRKRLAGIITKVLVAFLSISVLLVVLAFLFGDDLLVFLYGESIAEYTYLLIPTILVVVVTALMTLFLDLLVSFRKLKIAFLANSVSLAVVLLAGDCSMVSFGMNGVNVLVGFAFFCGFVFGVVLLVVERLFVKK